jgi:hypothetical protein
VTCQAVGLGRNHVSECSSVICRTKGPSQRRRACGRGIGAEERKKGRKEEEEKNKSNRKRKSMKNMKNTKKETPQPEYPTEINCWSLGFCGSPSKAVSQRPSLAKPIQNIGGVNHCGALHIHITYQQ